MDLQAFARRAIGVPFLEGGRDFDGWDCYGLCFAAYKFVLGAALPDRRDYAIREYAAIAKIFDARSSVLWKRLDAAQPMALAAIYRRNAVIHTGLVLPNRRILHVEEGIETCAQPFAAFRVEGFYVPTDSIAAPVQG